MVDFAAFGERADDQLTSMAVTVTAPPQLPRELRRTLTRQALVYMGKASGSRTRPKINCRDSHALQPTDIGLDFEVPARYQSVCDPNLRCRATY